jgi:tripartite-type tricarboxylate transporter receptor subunit TctC
MQVARRKLLHLVAGAAALSTSRAAYALNYPTRPVHLLTGFPAGGIVDIMARLIGQQLSERLGQPFVIEDRPGAGGNLATEDVVKAAPDGYTLLGMSAVNSWNMAVYDRLKFDFLHDIAPVASIEQAGEVMEVTTTFPAKTIPEFIGYAKAHPGKIIMATAGPGSGPHLFGELFKLRAGVDLLTVHCHGSGPALPDLIAGRADVMFDPVASSIGYIRAGRLRPLGVTTLTRLDVLPSVPSISEIVPGYEGIGWTGIGAPAKTAPEIIAVLNKAVNAALSDPAFKTRLNDLGVQPLSTSPSEFGKFLTQYTEKWSKVINAAGIKAG